MLICKKVQLHVLDPFPRKLIFQFSFHLNCLQYRSWANSQPGHSEDQKYNWSYQVQTLPDRDLTKYKENNNINLPGVLVRYPTAPAAQAAPYSFLKPQYSIPAPWKAIPNSMTGIPTIPKQYYDYRSYFDLLIFQSFGQYLESCTHLVLNIN